MAKDSYEYEYDQDLAYFDERLRKGLGIGPVRKTTFIRENRKQFIKHFDIPSYCEAIISMTLRGEDVTVIFSVKLAHQSTKGKSHTISISKNRLNEWIDNFNLYEFVYGEIK